MSTDTTDAVLDLARQMQADTVAVARETAASMGNVGAALARLAGESREYRADAERTRTALEDAIPLLRELHRERTEEMAEKVRLADEAGYKRGMVEGRRKVTEEADWRLATRRAYVSVVSDGNLRKAVVALLVLSLTACGMVIYHESGMSPPGMEASP